MEGSPFIRAPSPYPSYDLLLFFLLPGSLSVFRCLPRREQPHRRLGEGEYPEGDIPLELSRARGMCAHPSPV